MSDWIPLVGASISAAGAIGAASSVILAKRRLEEDRKRKHQLRRLTVETHRALLRLQEQEGNLQAEAAAAKVLLLKMSADAQSEGTLSKDYYGPLMAILENMQAEVLRMNSSTAELDGKVGGLQRG